MTILYMNWPYAIIINCIIAYCNCANWQHSVHNWMRMVTMWGVVVSHVVWCCGAGLETSQWFAHIWTSVRPRNTHQSWTGSYHWVCVCSEVFGRKKPLLDISLHVQKISPCLSRNVYHLSGFFELSVTMISEHFYQNNMTRVYVVRQTLCICDHPVLKKLTPLFSHYHTLTVNFVGRIFNCKT